MLKAELHIHTKDDHCDSVNYTAKEVIDKAAGQNYELLAFTCHDKVIHSKELEEYAKERNILLIPGVEKTIEGKHVLIYNLTEEEAKAISSFQKLVEIKRKKQQEKQPFLVIAPHPFYLLPCCLKKKVLKYPELFDGWEYSYFYNKIINPNKKMIKLAGRYSKPVLGNSDVHELKILGKTYSLISAKKDINSVFKAIKNRQIEIKTAPLSFGLYLGVAWMGLLSWGKVVWNKAKGL